MVGLGFRLYFSPEQLKDWAVAALERHAEHYDIKFREAELSLARGSLPQFAIVLKGVEVGPRPVCTSVPALKISEVRFPLRMWKLLAGEVAIGTISGEELTFDIDAFKTKCLAEGKPAIESAPTSTAVSGERSLAAVPEKTRADETSDAKPWWKAEQLEKLQRTVSGFEFNRVEIWFEKRSKRVVLESFALSSAVGEEFIHLTTDLRVPPEVTYGQVVPPLTIEADAKADSAEISVRAALSEGSLEGVARLRPDSNNQMLIDARVAVSDLPLSTTVPLLTKAGIVKENFRPRFLWLDCSAKIKGRFQGLFREQPIQLEDCSIEGNSGLIQVSSALRHPNGNWEPFQVRFENVDLRRMIETFGGKGPDGVASDFGRVSGALAVQSPREARFDGVFEGAQVRFSNRSVRALQGVTRMHAKLNLKDDRMAGSVDRVELDRGQFQGSLKFDADREFRTGSVKIDVESLILDPLVQKVLVAGEIGRMAGAGEASIADGKVASVKGDWRVEHLNGREFRFKNAQFRTEYGGNDFHVTVKAPVLELSRFSSLFVAGRPLFFGHVFEGEWIPIADTTVRAIVSDTAGLEWESAEGKMENGKIGIVSAGSLDRDRQLSGWVSLDYPAVKKLKWAMSGVLTAPVFMDDSKSLTDLRARGAIDDAVLGLPTREKVASSGDSTMRAVTVKTTRGLRQLGEKVIEKAREIVPKVSKSGTNGGVSRGGTAPVSIQGLNRGTQQDGVADDASTTATAPQALD